MNVNKPTPDKLHIDFWNKNPTHPARKIVDNLLKTRSDWVVSYIDRYWWYELVYKELIEIGYDDDVNPENVNDPDLPQPNRRSLM